MGSIHGPRLRDLVKVSDEGDVTGMDAAPEKLVGRHPWLSMNQSFG
jgi:hypothetical protein